MEIIRIRTNAGIELVAVDHEERTAVMYAGTDGWQYDHTASDVEDISSWSNIVDYDEIMQEIEREETCTVIESAEFDT